MNKLASLRCLRLQRSAAASSLLYGKPLQQQVRSFGSTPAALAGGFAKDFKPGPYPTTEAERIAAAKKYNMR